MREIPRCRQINTLSGAGAAQSAPRARCQARLCKMLVVIGFTAVMNRPESLQWHSLLLARKGASLTKAYIGMGLTRNELMTPSVKRVGLRSPLFARRTIFLATDVAMGALRS